MASANVLFGKVGGLPVYESGFTSAAVASGAVSAAIPAGSTHMRVAAIGGAIYAAFGTGTPDPSANPRVYIADGAAFDVNVPVGTKVGVLTA